MPEASTSASRPRVFVTRRISDAPLAELESVCDVDVWDGALPPPAETLLEKIRGCHGILSLLSDKIDGPIMDAAGDQLKVISNFAVGYNNIDVQAAAERGIRVGNTPDVLTDATADIAVTLAMAVARRVKEGIKEVETGGWKTWEPIGLLGTEFAGKTLGIVGMGRIGMATARRLCGGWSMKLLYTSRSPKPEADQELGGQRVELEQLVAESDLISLHTNLTDLTHHLIDAKCLASMKDSAILVNTARGEVIDQDALVVALKDGQIRGAGLDVTTPEPLSPQHPLVGLPNCLILPHVGSGTDHSRGEMTKIACGNILAALADQPMPAEVKG